MNKKSASWIIFARESISAFPRMWHSLRSATKKSAFTLTEVLLVMFIIGIVAVCLFAVFNPNRHQPNMYYIYATVRNIQTVNEDLVYMNQKEGGLGLPTNDYCMQFQDAISTKGAYNCDNNDTDNFVMSNGVSVKGMADGWSSLTNVHGRTIRYKDITFDVDGSKGRNAKGTDRFTVRIYKANGMVVPVDNLNDLNVFRYRAVSFPKRDNRIITELGTFGQVACETGWAGELGLTDITPCPVTNTAACPTPQNCEIQLLGVPSIVRTFVPLP